MKYEAKAETNAGGSFDSDGLSVTLSSYKPASVATNQPWRDITRINARMECQSLGAGYDLISNAQWQTMARNIEIQGVNWTSGSVGSLCLFQGNNNNTGCGYNGADPVTSSSNARGIFTLSNGETVYDFAGNVFEWVRDNNSTNYGSNAFFASITAATHTTMGILSDGVSRSAKAQFGPSGTYSTANDYSGLGNGWVNSSSGAIMRGGNWNDPQPAGVFHVWLGYGMSSSYSTVGFRCVWTPDDCTAASAIGTVCHDGSLYAGTFDGGTYFITPGGCNDSSTPTCSGGIDTLQKIWRGVGGTNVDIPGVTNVATDPVSSSSAQRGHVVTPILIAHASINSDSAADYCNNMVYAGKSDWYLGSKSEMNYIYCKADGVPSHNTSFPQAAVNCTGMGGRTYDITGFNNTAVYYLASTEVSVSQSWKQSFNNGDNDIGFKYQSNYIRCIRRQ